MRNEGGEVHADTDEARGGSTPNIVRWVLGISLLAAIVLLSAIWIFGAATTDDTTHEATTSAAIREAQGTADTDGIVSEDADEFAPETPADVIEGQEAPPARTIEN